MDDSTVWTDVLLTWGFLAPIAALFAGYSIGTAWAMCRMSARAPLDGPEDSGDAGGWPVLHLHQTAARRSPHVILGDEANEAWRARPAPSSWRGV